MARLLIVEDNRELASLMVAAAQSRGHSAQAVHTGEEALALLRPKAFDAAVVDLHLPDMRGSELLTALIPHAIPAIAISGVYKGDRLAREAITVYGARDFFPKPFELDALLLAIEQKCGLPRTVLPPPPPPEAQEEEEAILELMDVDVASEEAKKDDDDGDDDDGDDDDEVTQPFATALPPDALLPEEEPPPRAAHPVLGPDPALLAELAEATATSEPRPGTQPPVDQAPAPPSESEAEPGPEPELQAPEEPEVLPFGQREKVWAKQTGQEAPTPVRVGRRTLPEWTLEGEIKEATIPRLLNAYYEARHHGELKLKQGQILKVVYFEAGKPVYAASNLAHERFARFCARRGLLSESDLQAVSALSKEGGVRTGDAMMRLGLLDAEKRRVLVEDQVKEIIWSAFAWSSGGYGFSPMRLQRAGLVPLSIFPGDLILEGVLKLETLMTLRQKMPRARRLTPTADAPYALHELKLTGPQAMLLAYADGSKTVEDLLTLTDLSERETLGTLHGLELMGILQERREEPSKRRISFGL
ncbi:response regulator [Hyalangium sp.]|uniref:response regulator n=1 Tax=Hyalangium sp. TaxID=2028555 RepID=UPI002D3882F9|nr:response regulator [Hyalangium sp.]HYH99575.1 response regulator [Hyalangium sp.]